MQNTIYVFKWFNRYFSYINFLLKRQGWGDQWWDLVNMVMNNRVPQKARNFLTSQAINLQKNALFRVD
jgi:hypothetical protein